MMCDTLGIDVWEVVDAAATKPFGFMPFYPGPGLGGHCIPIDPFDTRNALGNRSVPGIVRLGAPLPEPGRPRENRVTDDQRRVA